MGCSGVELTVSLFHCSVQERLISYNWSHYLKVKAWTRPFFVCVCVFVCVCLCVQAHSHVSICAEWES